MNYTMTAERGKAAEYHVNTTLASMIGASRWKGELNPSNRAFLFDSLVLPISQREDSSLTETDHVLICPKGIFSIETKSISGRVFGEHNSKEWYTVRGYAGGKDGLTDRVFRNPFRQNAIHVKAIRNVLGGTYYVHNIVILVDANASGWGLGQWAGKEVDNLYLSAPAFVKEMILGSNVLKKDEVNQISQTLQSYYERKDVLWGQFKKQLEKRGNYVA